MAVIVERERAYPEVNRHQNEGPPAGQTVQQPLEGAGVQVLLLRAELQSRNTETATGPFRKIWCYQPVTSQIFSLKKEQRLH